MRSGTINEWKLINEPSQIAVIENESYEKSVVIFKNSTRCAISQSMLMNFQDSMKEENIEKVSFYLLDITKNRDISSAIAHQFKIQHESPQLLVIRNGECNYHKSHWNISFFDLLNYIDKS
jgi:bacillithiol system protein YtxJ